MAKKKEPAKATLRKNLTICENCEFWSLDDKRCRKYAPRPTGHASTSNQTFWPVTKPDDSCGEFGLKRQKIRAGGGWDTGKGVDHEPAQDNLSQDLVGRPGEKIITQHNM